MIPQFMSSSPILGSVLTAQSLEPAFDSVCPSLSAPPCSWSVSLCLSKINKKHPNRQGGSQTFIFTDDMILYVENPKNSTKKLLELIYEFSKKDTKSLYIGTWVAQSVERQTSAQIIISQFVGSSPTSGSVLTAQSLEPASDSVSPSLSALPHSHSVSFSQK